MWEILGSGDFWENFWATVKHLIIGFTIAFVLGTALGIAMGRSPYWNGFFRDYVMVTLTMPGLIFALIAVMIFGLSALGPIVAIVLTSMPHITVNVVEGVRAIPRDLLDMATAYGVDRRTRLRSVIFPALAPYLFTAVRYGFAIAWKITALTELFGGADGVGYPDPRGVPVLQHHRRRGVGVLPGGLRTHHGAPGPDPARGALLPLAAEGVHVSGVR